MIKFEGREWRYDEDEVTVQQAIAMHLAYGFTLRSWQEAIPQLDPRAMQCCYWLMLQQNGTQKPIKDCDFDLIGFLDAYGEALAQPEAAEEADPTLPPPAGQPDGRTASRARGSRTATTQEPRDPQEAATA